ncbi:hypothetical protein H3V53_14580 [Paraburkholderia bengalensis]|uniref:Uncharacterized protein n=1 Tax=Paraburkholderia bengalensis TaxID=2747562 RepID=A0ABU8IRX9_9BURK
MNATKFASLMPCSSTRIARPLVFMTSQAGNHRQKEQKRKRARARARQIFGPHEMLDKGTARQRHVVRPLRLRLIVGSEHGPIRGLLIARQPFCRAVRKSQHVGREAPAWDA